MLADQNLKKIAAETEKMAAIIKAKQEGQEAEIAAQTQLKVAEVEYRTAEAKAKASILAAEAQKRVIAEKNRSEAEVMLRSIEAYGTGENYVNAMLYRKMMPNIRSIIYNGAGQGTFGLPIAGEKKENGGDK